MMRNIASLLFSFGLVVGLQIHYSIAAQSADSKASAARPNIVVILSDDLGWGSVGCYGANPDLVKTPSIDRLAKEGRRFTDANTTSSVCSPTRYALLTGRYCWRTSLVSEVLGVYSPLHIETDRLTVASMLKAQGYSCAAVGKWHLGYGKADRCDYTQELKPGPLEIGFDYHFGVPSNHGDVTGVYVENHRVYGLDRQSPTSPSAPYMTMQQRNAGAGKSLDLNAPKRIDDEVMATITDKAVQWIEKQNSDKPFFLYFTPVAVHNPITPSKQTSGKSKGGPFCDFVHDLDTSVGRVLEALDKRGLTQNTLVLFSSDNGGVNKPNPNNKVGDETPQNVAIRAGLQPCGPFRGGKHDVWEGGFRVPYLIRWPGHVPANSVSDETISIVDTLASIAKITGASLPKVDQGAEDSFDVSKAWLGKDYQGSLRPELIVHSADGNFAIRKNGWKWIEGIPADDVKPAAKKARAAQMQPMLYQLKNDIAESVNVVGHQATVAQEMEALLNRYRDGGYSRELPPIQIKPKAETAALSPLNNAKKLDWKNFRGIQWRLRDGAMFGAASEKGSPLIGPVDLGDGTIDFKVLLGAADRHSLRIHTIGNKQSFRIVLSRSQLEVAINPAVGDASGKATILGSKRIKFKPNDWQPIRLTFVGDELTVQCAGVALPVKHAIIAEPKEQIHFIAFEGEVGIKEAQVASPELETQLNQASE